MSEIFSQEAEMCALGSGVWGSSGLEVLTDCLRTEDFFTPAHQQIFEAMQEMFNQGKPVDIQTLRAYLEARGTLEFCGGFHYLLQIGESVPSPSNAREYAGVVHGFAVGRRIESAAKQAALIGRDKTLTPAEMVERSQEVMFAASESVMDRNRDTAVGIKQAVSRYTDFLDEQMDGSVPNRAVATRWGCVNRKLTGGGLKPKQFVVIGARPGCGKSVVGIYLTLDAAKARRGHVLHVSLEMGQEELLQRMTAMKTGLGLKKLSGALTDAEMQQVRDAMEFFYHLPLSIYDGGRMTLTKLRSESKKLQRTKDGLALIVVDYLGLLSSGTKSNSGYEEVSKISRGLKQLAMELDVPIVAMAQLNREVKDDVPRMAHLRDSGSIEQDADMVILIHRPQMQARLEDERKGIVNTDDEPFHLICEKQRNGAPWFAELKFAGEAVTLYELDRRYTGWGK